MKRSVVAILVAISVGLACSAATKTFTNTTGQAATQIVVTFSEPVRITSYDKSVFPDQSPASGECDSFTFSGGTVAAGSTFQVAWSPNTARMITSSWLSSLVPTGARRRGVCARLELLGPRDVRVLAEQWNVNLIRLQIGIMGARGIFGTLFSKNPADPVALPEDLARLDEVLDECAAVGIAVLIDLHQTAGYEYIYSELPKDSSLWRSEALQKRLVQFWEAVSQHCAERGSEVYGYDLLNEAHEDNGVWNALAKKLTQAIRIHDTTHPIIVESSDYASPKAFSSLVPTQDPNTIYSFHFYLPDEFAQQGEHGNPIGAKYPTQAWNRVFLEDQIQSVIQFQKRWHVPILAGEFAVPCYADPESRAAYFEDCMSLFEKEGFDYCYYAYRDTERYDLDHDSYRAEWGILAMYVGPTPALDVALKHFAANSPALATTTQTPPKCLFDEAHWQSSASSQFVRDRNMMTEQLACRISSYCEVAIHASGAISSDDLNGIDLLVLGRTTVPLTPAETAAIESFVAAGGSVLVYGDVDASLSVNSLLGPMGIRFDNRVVVSAHYDWDPESFWVPFAPLAGVLKNGGAFHTNWGGSLSVTLPARSILATDADAWIDVNRNERRDAGDIGGPLTLAAVAEPGAGRVAVLADNPFSDSRPVYFAMELVRWLLHL